MRRELTLWLASCVAAALVLGFADRSAVARPTGVPLAAQSIEPSPEPTATVTPLPMPPVPPPDAAGISATTPPIGVVSPQPAPTLPDTLWLADADTSTVPLSLHGGRPFVQVVVDGVRRDFLVSSLRPTTADQSLPVDGANNAPMIRTLQIGDVRLIDVGVHRARVIPFAQTYLGAPATGILGTDLFSKYPVKIDYPNRTLTVYRSEAVATAARPAGIAPLNLELVAGLPAVSCAVDDKVATPCFVDVFSNADIALWHPSGMNDQSRRSIGMRVAEIDHEVNGSVERAQALTIGSITVPHPLLDRMGPSEDEYEPPTVRALLGSGALSRFAVTLDEPGGKLILEPSPSAIAAPSVFDGSGLWLVWRGGAVVVRSVVPRSPADRAGLQGGDILLAIDGSPPLDLDAARAAFERPTGTKVPITYARRDLQRTITLTLRSLI